MDKVSTLRLMEKAADLQVDGKEGMARLEALTRRLLTAPNSEVQAALAEEKRAKVERKRKESA
jgi:hypothetical protein